MTLDEFRRLAESWGVDVTRWPPDARAQAEPLARRAEGAAILAALAPLDRRIAAAAPDVSQERVGRAIHGVVTRLAADQPRRAMLPRWLVPAAGLAGAVALGVLLGVVEPMLASGQTDDLSGVLT